MSSEVPEVLETLKDIEFVLAVHQIDRAFFECCSELCVIWEAGTLLLRQKRVLELLDIVVLSSVVPDDLAVQHEEDFVEGIRRQVAHRPAEQVVLRCQEYLSDLSQRQFPLVIQAQHFKEVRPCYRRLQTIQPVNARIKSGTARITVKENLVALCICQHLSEERLRLDLPKLDEVLEVDVDLLLLWDGLLFHAEVIADEGAHIILRANLDLVPVLLVVILLLLGGQAHKDEVPDFVTFAEVEAGRVQALKDELGIVIHVQTDVYDLQTADRVVKLVDGDFLLLNPVIEVIVVHGQVGLANVLGRIREQLPESRLVILHRLELYAGILRLPFVHEVFLENALLEVGCLRYDDALVNQVIHGKEQQRHRRKALLAVDDQEFLVVAIRIVNGNKAPEEVALSVSLDDFYKVIVQLLAVLGLPVVIPLVHRNDKTACQTPP